MMKKTFSFVFILVLIILLCACGNKSSSMDYTAVIPSEAQPIDFSNSVTIVSSPTPVPNSITTPTPVPNSVTVSASTPVTNSAATPVPVSSSTPIPVTVTTPTPKPSVTPIPTPTSTITIVNVNNSNPITKSPYSDTVAAGGRVTFYATANNYSAINWKIKDPDGSIYFAADAPNRYTGLVVSGINSTKLELNNVPSSMNNCLIQTVFTVAGTDYYSSNAKLTVTGTTVDDSVQQSAYACLADFTTAGNSNGCTVSQIQNYSVNEQIADFNITFTKGVYTIIGQFNATASRYFPIYVMVTENGNILGQKALTASDPNSEFIEVLKDPTNVFTAP